MTNIEIVEEKRVEQIQDIIGNPHKYTRTGSMLLGQIDALLGMVDSALQDQLTEVKRVILELNKCNDCNGCTWCEDIRSALDKLSKGEEV